MSCRRFRKSLLEYADGHLSGARGEKVESHVEGCVRCRAALEKLATSRTALADLGRVEMPEEAGQRVFSKLSSVAAGKEPAPARPPGRLDFLLTPRALGIAGTAAALIIAAVVVVGVYSGGSKPGPGNTGISQTTTVQPASTSAGLPIPKNSGRSSAKSEQKTAQKAQPKTAVPGGTAAIMPIARVSNTNYDVQSLHAKFDNLEIKKEIAERYTMAHAISLADAYRRKIADMMVGQGEDGALLEAMILYVSSSEPALLPYYAECAFYSGQKACIIGLAGPRRTGKTNKLTHTEVWVFDAAKFESKPESSVLNIQNFNLPE